MQTLFQCLKALLIFLWIYAAATKLINFQLTKAEMAHQIFDESFSSILAWLVPAVELLTGFLLAIPLTARYGLVLSALLLGLFTIYVVGGVMHWYETMPCACGGVIRHMTWGWHLAFNCCFLVINVTTLMIEPSRKEVSASH
ncbi:MAG TPA: MauE/DoxX family redox-associated membrane protein [Puia sp.]|nr:MauE/DoxX family redox-associated membrane protein [Puia sp.]